MANLPAITGDNTLSNSFLGNVIEVCVASPDFRRTMAELVRAGIGPWRVYTLGPETAQNLTYRGKSGNYSAKLVLAFTGSMLWQIVQPLTGPSLYADFLEKHGEGVYTIAFDCHNVAWEERLKAFKDHGYDVTLSGVWLGQVPYAYFETEGDNTTILKTYAIPGDFVLPEPEAWYPGQP